MHTRTRRGLIPLLVLPAMVAWATPANQLTMQAESRLWVDGTSTVRDFSCRATNLDVSVSTTGTAAVANDLAAKKAVGSVVVRVPARQLDCSNGTMNEHMLKALKASDHAEIAFRLNSYDLSAAAGSVQAKLAGTLSLGGVEKPVLIDATAEPAGAGQLRVKGSHNLVMSEYGLKRPSLMMGTMKVGDRVKVSFDLLLKE